MWFEHVTHYFFFIFTLESFKISLKEKTILNQLNFFLYYHMISHSITFNLEKKFLHTPSTKNDILKEETLRILNAAQFEDIQISKCIYSFGLIPIQR